MPEAVAEKQKRTRTPEVYFVQQYDEKTKTWADVSLPEAPDDTIGAVKGIKDLAREGRFRVLAIKREFAIKTELKTVVRVS